jgi:hypothetical protein
LSTRSVAAIKQTQPTVHSSATYEETAMSQTDNTDTMDRKIAVDAAAEDSYWRQYYGDRPYMPADASYDDFGPAYGYGVKAFTDNPGRSFDDMESDLSQNWDAARRGSSLTWEGAKQAVRDAWHRLSDRIERAISGDSS